MEFSKSASKLTGESLNKNETAADAQASGDVLIYYTELRNESATAKQLGKADWFLQARRTEPVLAVKQVPTSIDRPQSKGAVGDLFPVSSRRNFSLQATALVLEIDDAA